jgi:CO/xanthine dehydrogenase Mo-binding subunit
MSDTLKPTSKPLSVPVNRRKFLQSIGVGTGLVVAWSTRADSTLAGFGGSSEGAALSALNQQGQQAPPPQMDAYLRVNEDGTITVLTGKIEFGQGIQTGFGQIVAEELYLPFEKVDVIHGTTSMVPNDGPTAGSSSTRRTGMVIRRAAAEMREWLTELAAEELGVDAADLVLADGVISVGSDATKSTDFGTLAAGKSSMREVREDIALKDPAEYTVVGQSIPRVDVPFKVNGAMKYGIDAMIEGMVYGKIVRPPARGATIAEIDLSEAEKMPGVVGVFHDGDFAGLAAERLQQAEAALAAVKVTWNLPATTTTSDTIFDVLRATPDAGRVLGIEEGAEVPDPAEAIAASAQTIKSTFSSPYISHSPIEPKSSLASITDEKVEIWTSTQSPFSVRTAVATLLERPEEEIIIYPLMGGGAFGSKVQPDSEMEAVRLANAVGRPVKIIWTRKEEFQDARFRPAMLVDVEAGLDADGNITGWDYNLFTAGYFPEGAETPTAAGAAQVAHILDIYELPIARTTHFQSAAPLPPYYWRVNGSTTNIFAREVMMDQLAEAAGEDPVTFRSKMLTNQPRMKAVLDAAVEKAGWTPGVGSTGQGIGVAIALDTQSYIAEVAQVDVNVETGQVTVKHFTCAADIGTVINPLAVTVQAEGSVIMGLSPTLREQTTFENGRVTNASFGQYQPIRMSEAPTVDVVFVEDKSMPFGGVGEPFVSPVQAAVANAIYDAIGVRLYAVPFTPDKVLAAIAEQA